MKNKIIGIEKDNKGITLTALVITIIVLLILAGVTFSSIVDENGAIAKAIKAGEAYRKSAYLELINLEIAAEEIADTQDVDEYLNNIKGRLEKNVDFDGSTYSLRSGSRLIINTKEGYQYVVTKGKVIEVDPEENDQTTIPELKDGEIVFTYKPAGWTDGNVLVGIDAPTHPVWDIEWTEDYTAEHWNTYTSEIPVTSNKSIFARLKNEAGASNKYATAEVKHIDTTDPVIVDGSFKQVNDETLKSGFIINIEMLDSESGISEIIWNYKPKDGTGKVETKREVFTELHSIKAGEKDVSAQLQVTSVKATIYEVTAVVYDVAGNSKLSDTIDVTVAGVADVDASLGSYSPSYYTNGNVTVTLNIPTGLKTYYTLDGSLPTLDNPNIIEYTVPFELSANGTVMYVHSDGVNVSKKVGVKNVQNIDKTGPNVNLSIPESSKTTNSFTITGKVQDAESGIGSIAFYYRNKTKNETTFKQKIWSNPNNLILKTYQSTQSGYTGEISINEPITGLTTGTYEVYAIVINTANVTTDTSGSAKTIILDGLISVPTDTASAHASPAGTWTKDPVTITLPKDTSGKNLETRYTDDGVTLPAVNSELYTNEFTVASNKTIMYAYSDGVNITSPGVVEVKNIDTTPAVAGNMSKDTSNSTSTKLRINLPVSDNASGIDYIDWYYKTQTGGSWNTTAVRTETTKAQTSNAAGINGTGPAVGSETTLYGEFSGLTQNTPYVFYAIVYDVAGNPTPVGSQASPVGPIYTDIQKATDITISPNTNQTVDKLGTLTLTATLEPSTINNNKVTWSSSNTSAADFGGNSTKEVTSGTSVTLNAKSVGATTITAVASDGSGVAKQITVNVVNPITAITLSPTSLSLSPNETSTVTATTTPSGASASLMTWESTNSAVATVSGNGKSATVTAVAPGTATIRAKSIDNDTIKGECTVTVSNPTIHGGRSLADVVEIGDYVNIGINYENKQSFSSNSYVTTQSALTGWRVLSKDGGVVKLVSAGCPLTFYHKYQYSSTSIPLLADLYKTSLTTSGDCYFNGNGFSSTNLQTVFSGSTYVDTTKGVHALGCATTYNGNSGTTGYAGSGEVEAAYQAITGTSKTMTQLYGNYTLGTTTLKSAAGANWKESYTDLLANGQYYWLGGSSCSTSSLWTVRHYGSVYVSNNSTNGVRPVVSLKSGVKVSSTNMNDGSSSSKAYNLSN